MGFYDKNINGFQPYQNEAGTLPEYTDEQIDDMFALGDIVAGEDGLPKVVPRSKPTAADKQSQYERRVDELIRSKYTLSQELAILRQQASKNEEYQAYFDFCEDCKVNARKEVYGDEI